MASGQFMRISRAADNGCPRMDRRVHLAVNRIKAGVLMIKVATILRAQLAVSAAVLLMSGGAFAQGDIGCVDGMPAPPFTQICPPTSVTKAFAEAPVRRSGSCAQKYRSFDAASGTYLGRDGVRRVCQ